MGGAGSMNVTGRPGMNDRMDLKPKCYVHGGAASWQAICVDLNVAVCGNSQLEVRASLFKAVDLYLQTVATLPAVERGGFLSRRTPWHMCASLAILAWFSALGCGRNRSQAFTFQSRMPPNLSGTASTCGVVSV